MTLTNTIIIITLSALLVAVALFASTKYPAEPEKISRFGEYRGYSEPRYDGYERHSDYLLLANGNRLAYDVLIPTREGAPPEDPLPVLLAHTTYLRAFLIFDRETGKVIETDVMDLNWIAKTFIRLRAHVKADGHIFDITFRNRWARTMLKHGYVIVVVERQGTGASSGVIDPAFAHAAREADAILNWIAAQPWCDGNIGMFGESFVAMTQYAAASANNPHLKAIAPTSSSFDMYGDLIYPGGIFNKGFVEVMGQGTAALEKMVVPVDSDEDGAILAQILAERRARTLGEASSRGFAASPYRDSDSPHPQGDMLWEDMGLYNLLDAINQSGVAVYNATGWYDIFTRSAFLWHANLRTPHRLLVRPCFHEELGSKGRDLDQGVEAHRWFDYWLKGIDNGILDEPPIHYYVTGAPQEDAWRAAESWPLPDQQPTRLYLAAGPSDSITSINDGCLHPQPPGTAQAFDTCVVDYTTSTGPESRWTSIIEVGAYPDMRARDARALTYTTDPLTDDTELTGHAIAHLWLAADVPDVDCFVYLEDVDVQDHATYVSEGILRASHRLMREAPFDTLGLPYRRSYEADLHPLPLGEPVELVIDLLPTSRLFLKGHRIRVTVAGADADNFETPALSPPPEIHLYRDATHASYIELPILR